MYKKLSNTKKKPILASLKQLVVKGKIDCFYSIDSNLSEPLTSYLVMFLNNKPVIFHFVIDTEFEPEQFEMSNDHVLVITVVMGVRLSHAELQGRFTRRVSSLYLQWEFEDSCVKRLDALFKKQKQQEKDFPLSQARIAKHYQDLFMGIDIEVLYENRWIPIQIKQSSSSFRQHRRDYPNVPVWKYEKSYHDGRILDEILNLCSEASV